MISVPSKEGPLPHNLTRMAPREQEGMWTCTFPSAGRVEERKRRSLTLHVPGYGFQRARRNVNVVCSLSSLSPTTSNTFNSLCIEDTHLPQPTRNKGMGGNRDQFSITAPREWFLKSSMEFTRNLFPLLKSSIHSGV